MKMDFKSSTVVIFFANFDVEGIRGDFFLSAKPDFLKLDTQLLIVFLLGTDSR